MQYHERIMTALLACIVAGYPDSGRGHLPQEKAIRDLLLERSDRFEVTDVAGSPWIEIDFTNDRVRAAPEVLPPL